MQEEVFTKEEFLYALKRALSGEVSPEVFNDNMSFYEEYISSEISKGKTELEVMRSLGEPRLIAKTIIETSSAERRNAYSDASFEKNENRAQSQESGDGGRARQGRKVHIISGWKVYLLLFAIIAVIVLLLFLIFKAIESLFFFLGPLFVVIILMLLLRMKD